MDLTFLAATGYVSFGIVIGALAEDRVWWLVCGAFPRRDRHKAHLGCCRLPLGLASRPLPRPWRRPRRAYGRLWQDTVRHVEDFAIRWDAQHPAN